MSNIAMAAAQRPEANLKANDFLYEHEDVVDALVEAYLTKLHPAIPFFHATALRQAMEDRDYDHNETFAIGLVALCALTARRIKDGAFEIEIEPKPTLDPDFAKKCVVVIENYHLMDFSQLETFEWLRIWALMALYGLQIGDSFVVHRYMGHFTTLVACHRLHDERNWPNKWKIIGREIVRRVIWGAYMIEVYSAAVFGNILRLRGAQMDVLLPAHVMSDCLLRERGRRENGRIVPAAPTTSRSWLNAWNRTVEAYRHLESFISAPQPIDPLQLKSLLRDIEAVERTCALDPSDPNEIGEPRMIAYANFYTTQLMIDVWVMKNETPPPGGRMVALRGILHRVRQIATERSGSLFAPILPILGGLGSLYLTECKVHYRHSQWCRLLRHMEDFEEVIENMPKGKDSPLIQRASKLGLFIAGAQGWCQWEYTRPQRRKALTGDGAALRSQLRGVLPAFEPDPILKMEDHMFEELVWPLEFCEGRLNGIKL